MNNKIPLTEIDAGLKPYEDDLILRMELYKRRREQLLEGCTSLNDFANGHLYYGFHKNQDDWVYREWAPNADALHLIGDFNGWNRETHPLQKLGNGNWELKLSGQKSLYHASEVKLQVTAGGKVFDRIPLYIRRAVQKQDYRFNGQIWDPPTAFQWTAPQPYQPETLLIYECHIGISSEEPCVAGYRYFTENILPRVKRAGYNAIQIMALLEHPYYASFGYQVSNFFAASSRFGTPEELKELINTAHKYGIAVLCDMVHSHASANTDEGLGAFDGTEYQFFHRGEKGNHPAWGTKCFNYSKTEVIHFLLSNLKFWLEEYHLDGFRFDGVTSMLYHHHGLGVSFDHYRKYFSIDTDVDAVTYLQLASELVKSVNPNAVLIAEDMSGMPGMCVPIRDGGIGFDYRLSMGVPDFWIKTLAESDDRDWDLQKMWHELSTRRPREKNIGYCESHDQALVGDKTIFFWLADQELYWHMEKSDQSSRISRAMALHKMIRLVTFTLAGEGYLNFMGNEFGHPEWIDFPREGNGNSYHYARRQWSLADQSNLKYDFLQIFDRDMLKLAGNEGLFQNDPELLRLDNIKKTLLYKRGQFIFAFNFHPMVDWEISIPEVCGGMYQRYLYTDEGLYGGNDSTLPEQILDSTLRLSSRTGAVYKINEIHTQPAG